MTLAVPIPCPVCLADIAVSFRPHCKICADGKPGWRVCTALAREGGFARQRCGAVVDPVTGRFFRFKTTPKETDVDP